MRTVVLQGPFLTRRQAADALGISRSELLKRHDLLRIDGPIEEVYFEFQCRSEHTTREVGRIVLAFRGSMNDLDIADWLVRRNAAAGDLSPLSWIEHGWGAHHVLSVAAPSSERMPA